MRATHALFLTVALGLGACSGPTRLGDAVAPRPGDEAAALRRKSDEALAAGLYAEAWDLEARAGRDRARLEAIALTALEADQGPYEGMLPELRKAFGGLSAEGRARVDALAQRLEGDKRWKRAAGVQLVAADDAPAFQAAWGVYERTPPSHALGVLEAIEDARKDHAGAAAPGMGS